MHLNILENNFSVSGFTSVDIHTYCRDLDLCFMCEKWWTIWLQSSEIWKRKYRCIQMTNNIFMLPHSRTYSSTRPAAIRTTYSCRMPCGFPRTSCPASMRRWHHAASPWQWRKERWVWWHLLHSYTLTCRSGLTVWLTINYYFYCCCHCMTYNGCHPDRIWTMIHGG